MAKPLDEQTDEELETALAQGQLDERKAAIAREILSRRWQSKSEKIKGSYGWLGHVAAAVALALIAIRRLLGELERRKPFIGAKVPAHWVARRPNFSLRARV
jgi:hypothetical protein